MEEGVKVAKSESAARTKPVKAKHGGRNFLLLLLTCSFIPLAAGNPPQFVLNQGQSEIVLRLKEGKETPVGSLVLKLKGFDSDNDPLVFGLRGQAANEIFRIENLGNDEANMYLKKELDRETEDSYTFILTLTDGRLGGSFITQSLLVLVEDINDNAPRCLTSNSTIKVEENSEKVPLILSTVECTDLDEGYFGQVIYRLETDPGDEEL